MISVHQKTACQTYVVLDVKSEREGKHISPIEQQKTVLIVGVTDKRDLPQQPTSPHGAPSALLALYKTHRHFE